MLVVAIDYQVFGKFASQNGSWGLHHACKVVVQLVEIDGFQVPVLCFPETDLA